MKRKNILICDVAKIMLFCLAIFVCTFSLIITSARAGIEAEEWEIDENMTKENATEVLKSRPDGNFMILRPSDLPVDFTAAIFIKNHGRILKIPIVEMPGKNRPPKFILHGRENVTWEELKTAINQSDIYKDAFNDSVKNLTEIRAVKLPFLCEGFQGHYQINLSWLGSNIDEERSQKIIELCHRMKENKQLGQDHKKLLITLWHDDNLKSDNPLLQKINSACRRSDGAIEFSLNNSSQLFNGEKTSHDAYNFFKKQGVFAGASDVTRPLIMKNAGGCYLDIGFNYSNDPGLVFNRMSGKKNFFYGQEGVFKEGDYIYNLFDKQQSAVTADGKEITTFFNNNFMISNDKDIAQKFAKAYEKRLELLVKNPLLQLPLKKEGKLTTTAMLFYSSGPLAFTHALKSAIPIEAREVVALSNFSPAGKRSWKNIPDWMSSSNLHRKILGMCIEEKNSDFPKIEECFDQENLGSRDGCIFLRWAQFIENQSQTGQPIKNLDKINMTAAHFDSSKIYEKYRGMCKKQAMKMHEKQFSNEDQIQRNNIAVVGQVLHNTSRASFSGELSPALCAEDSDQEEHKSKSKSLVLNKDEIECQLTYDPYISPFMKERDPRSLLILCQCSYLAKSELGNVLPTPFHSPTLQVDRSEILSEFCQ